MVLSRTNLLFITVWVWQLRLLAGNFVNHQPWDDPDYFLDSDDDFEEHSVKNLLSANFNDEKLTLTLHRKDNQTIMANLEDEDDCIYTGYMIGCTTSRVLVTGCVGMLQSVQVQSRVFGDMVFTTNDGVVKPVGTFGNGRSKREADKDIDYDYDDEIENLEFEEDFADLDSAEVGDLPPPPKKLILNLNVYLDKAWKEEFGRTGGIVYAKRILKHATDLWDHESLDTKISIVTDKDRIYQSTKHLVPSKRVYAKELPKVLTGPDTLEGGRVAQLYLSFSKRPRLLGLAQVNGLCANSRDKPRAIVVFKNSEIRTAMTVAHELGHLLGVEHDFILGKRVEKCGAGKLSGQYVMNYGSDRQKWSQCSNNDFKVYYNRVALELGSFCIKVAVVGCKCNGKTDVLGNGKCETGKSWCYVNRDANCDDQENYNGKFISFLPCGASTGTESKSTRPTTTQRTIRKTTRRTTTRRTTRRPSSGSKSGSDPCNYKCLPNGNCHSTYIGKPRPGKKRGTCFAPDKATGSCGSVVGKLICDNSLCSGIPKECRKCNEIVSC